jgi:hypothetical protein
VPERPIETSATTVVLPRFLNAVAPRPAPVVLDLGPAIGANVTFLGERLACKLLIGDLCPAPQETPADGGSLRASVMARLERTVTSPLDAVLCWDIFEYFDRSTAQAVAEFLASRLLSGGVVHGYFASAPGGVDQYTRYVIQGPTALLCRHEPIGHGLGPAEESATGGPAEKALTGDWPEYTNGHGPTGHRLAH